MKKFTEYIGSQFGNPRGAAGIFCCLIMNTINRAMYLSLVAELRLEGRAKLLDIGYGNGYLIRKIYQKYGAQIYGIDISDDMKKLALRRNRKEVALGKIHLSTGDCCRLKYESGIFDVVPSVNTIYFWRDACKGMKEIFRVLKPDGTFYNVVYSKEWLQKLSYTKRGFRLFNRTELILLGKKAGFLNVSVKEIVSGKSYLVRYKK